MAGRPRKGKLKWAADHTEIWMPIIKKYPSSIRQTEIARSMSKLDAQISTTISRGERFMVEYFEFTRHGWKPKADLGVFKTLATVSVQAGISDDFVKTAYAQEMIRKHILQRFSRLTGYAPTRKIRFEHMSDNFLTGDMYTTLEKILLNNLESSFFALDVLEFGKRADIKDFVSKAIDEMGRKGLIEVQGKASVKGNLGDLLVYFLRSVYFQQIFQSFQERYETIG